MKLFVDTWGWLVLEDSKDPRHPSAVESYREGGGKIVTSNFVLDETFTLLFRRRPFAEAWRFTQGLLGSAKENFLQIELVSETRFREALALRQKFADKPRISFTDLTSMALMRELQLRDILTADAHFMHVGLGFQVLPA